MVAKTILITGATAGIGKATSFKLAELGHHLILLSRNKNKLKDTREEIQAKIPNAQVEIIECDLSSQKSIRKSAEIIKQHFPVIDVLINNAGINTDQHELTEDGIEKTFAVNHLAYFLLTGLLLDNIKISKQARIINVSSNGHRGVDLDLEKIKNNEYKGRYPTYRRSKLANVMFTIDLAEKLKDSDVRVNCLHPGLINTNIGMEDQSFVRRLVNNYKKRFAGSPKKGAGTIVYLATSAQVRNITGKYFVNRKIQRYSKKADNVTVRNSLWKLSEQLTGFSYP
ncbi:SDR family oxidoreductase [candidate division WWE3 bacterium]|jgi:NAD(P)-dependent dehydrogenase (short-subunit alcohol dehydrogenase family)|nr:SDR family oxidoreductase [candidate division WWE3 bacterium]MBT7349321.1 SDR family oxidoreductase [candidate division WWE3 bacterium]